MRNNRQNPPAQTKQIYGVNYGKTAKYIWLDQAFFIFYKYLPIWFQEIRNLFSLLEWMTSASLGFLNSQLKHTAVVRAVLLEPDKDCKCLQLSFSPYLTRRDGVLSNLHLPCISPKTFLLQVICLISMFKCFSSKSVSVFESCSEIPVPFLSLKSLSWGIFLLYFKWSVFLLITYFTNILFIPDVKIFYLSLQCC